MSHKALYRVWRPQWFRDVAGQQHITRTLQNSLKEGRISHAYLFCGPRGTGKTSAAKILAKAVNCLNGPAEEPCNECEVCKRITDGSEMGVLEIDAASNRGIDEIRNLRDKMIFAYSEVRMKVYIIDEVHMLTTEAFNALLKTLEEPPPNVMFILATTEPHKLPATIISRCQRFDFRRVPLEEQVGRLQFVCAQEGIDLEPKAAEYISRLSDGGMRDALSILDQAISYCGSRVTYEDIVSMTGGIASEAFEELAGAIRRGDIPSALQWIENMIQEGRSADRCLENLLLYFRDLLMIRMVPESEAVTDRILDVARFSALASEYSTEQLFRMIEVLNHYLSEIKYSTAPQTLLEVAVLKLCVTGREGTQPDSPAAVSGRETIQGGHGFAGGAAGAGLAPEVERELAALRDKVAKLEQQLTRLTQAGGSLAAGTAQPPADADASRRNAAHGRIRTSSLRRNAVQLDPFIQAANSEMFRQVDARWSQMMSKLRERNVKVYALMTNGEPKSIVQDRILVAFRSEFHREVVEKPDNRDLIEQVLADIMGQPLQLVTTMLAEWEEVMQSAAAGAESGQAEETTEAAGDGGEPEHIQKALELFGEAIVEIKD